MIVTRNEDWLSAEMDGEMVMMNVVTGIYIGLCEIASRIWQIIETPAELDALCRQMEQEFEVSHEMCEAHVREFLDDMVKHGAISLASVPA